MKNYVYVATSLDGYIATSDGGVEWLDEIPNPEGNDYGYFEFMSGIDALVMGRHTYEKVLSFGVAWPYDKLVFVLSTSLERVPAEYEGKVEILKGEPKEVVAEIHRRGYENLYVDGGRTVQSFLDEDLIDEMILTRVPILLGGGIPLFGELAEPLRFEHVETKVHDGILVTSRYWRIER